MRVRAEHQGRFQRAGQVGHVVEIARAAGYMPNGAIVGYGCMDAAANASEKLAHKASRRTRAADAVSIWKRRR